MLYLYSVLEKQKNETLYCAVFFHAVHHTGRDRGKGGTAALDTSRNSESTKDPTEFLLCVPLMTSNPDAHWCHYSCLTAVYTELKYVSSTSVLLSTVIPTHLLLFDLSCSHFVAVTGFFHCSG